MEILTRTELESVLDNLRLPNGEIWPLPILLDVDNNIAEKIVEGETVALLSDSGDCLGTIKVKEKYSFDFEKCDIRDFFVSCPLCIFWYTSLPFK